MNGFIKSFALLHFCFLLSWSQVDGIAGFSVDPARPTVNDEVTLTLTLGMHPNSCVPLYETSHSIEPGVGICTGFNCTQLFDINVEYKEIPDPTDPACLMVLTPYGPGWELGKLDAGTYTVTSDRNTFSFTVTGRQDTIPDIKPGRSTVSGTITEDAGMLTVWIPIEGAMVYLMNDIIIIDPPIDTLPYDTLTVLPIDPIDPNDPTGRNPILDSAVTDENGAFTFDPHPNGIYMISVSADGYMPAFETVYLEADTALNIALKRMGNVTLAENTPEAGVQMNYTPGKGLVLQSAESRQVEVKGYSVDGSLLPGLTWSGLTGPATNLYTNLPAGMYLFSIKGDALQTVQKINIR